MNNREKTEKKVFSYMEEHGMIAPHDSIVLGVSGGADSVCLLFLLLEYAKRVPLSLSVVHVNHGIRREAGEDAAYVKALCEQNNLPYYLTEVNVQELARQEKTSEEAVGRRVRYEAFERAARKPGSVKIAVAHNANDNAETMLFHLFRGTGLKGLSGIAPVRDNIIRPILCLERREVEEYLTGRGIVWREDCTNSGDDYTRNRIRHHILPFAEQEIVTGAVAHINRTSEMLRETEEFLEQQTRMAMECVVSEVVSETQAGLRERQDAQETDAVAEVKSGLCERQDTAEYVPGYEIDCIGFVKLSPVLQKRILLNLAKELSPTGKDISLVHVEDMMSLFHEEGNRSFHLPYGIVARREYGKVVLERVGDNRVRSFGRHAVSGGRENVTGNTLETVPALAEKFEFTHIFPEKGAEVPTNRYTKWFDYDKIIECPTLRFRQKGDYFTIGDGHGGMRHKTLKDYMIDEKIPRQQRDRIPVLAVGNHVVWLVGYRISEYFKVDGNTKSILQVKLIGSDCESSGTEEKDGREH